MGQIGVFVVVGGDVLGGDAYAEGTAVLHYVIVTTGRSQVP